MNARAFAWYAPVYLNLLVLEMGGSLREAVLTAAAGAYLLGARTGPAQPGIPAWSVAFLSLWMGVLASYAGGLVQLASGRDGWPGHIPPEAFALVAVLIAPLWRSTLPLKVAAAVFVASAFRLSDSLPLSIARMTDLPVGSFVALLYTTPVAYLIGATLRRPREAWGLAGTALLTVFAAGVLDDAAFRMFGKRSIVDAPLWVGDSRAFVAGKALACAVTLAGPLHLGWTLLATVLPNSKWRIVALITGIAAFLFAGHGFHHLMISTVKAGIAILAAGLVITWWRSRGREPS